VIVGFYRANCGLIEPLLPICTIFGIGAKKDLFAARMSPRRGIGRGRPKENEILLEEIRSLCTRMESVETT